VALHGLPEFASFIIIMKFLANPLFIVILASLSISACGGGRANNTGDSSSGTDQTSGTSSEGTVNINYNWPAHVVGYKITFTVTEDDTNNPTGIPPGSKVVYDYSDSGSVQGTNPVSGTVYYPDAYRYTPDSSSKNKASIFLEYSGGSATELYRLTATSPTRGTYEYTGNAGDSRGDMYNIGTYVINATGLTNTFTESYSFAGDGVNSISGSVSGNQPGLVLQTNQGSSITVSNEGSFSFSGVTQSDVIYDLSINNHPDGQTCTVNGYSSFTSFEIQCVNNQIGGSIDNLNGTLILQNQAGDLLTISSQSNYVFEESFNFAQNYQIVISSQPFGQECSMNNSEGIFINNINTADITCVDAIPQFELGLSGLDVQDKQLQAAWESFTGATHYELRVNEDGASGFSLLASTTGLSYTEYKFPVHLAHWDAASYQLAACNQERCISSTERLLTSGLSTSAEKRIGNTGATDKVAVSGDGNTIAFFRPDHSGIDVYRYQDNAWLVDSNIYFFSPGIEIDQLDDVQLNNDGTIIAYKFRERIDFVYRNRVGVYSANGSDWVEESVFDTINASDYIYDVALSSDGTTLAFNSADTIQIYYNNGAGWSLQDSIATPGNAGSLYRFALSLNADGSTLAAGYPAESSNAQGIDGNSNDTSSPSSGAVYVYQRNNSVWEQQAYIKASNAEGIDQDDQFGDQFGRAIDISGDGNSIIVGARGEDSNSALINGDQADNSASFAGAAYVFSRSNGQWTQDAYIKASNADQGDEFGYAVSISGNGQYLAIGAPQENSGYSDTVNPEEIIGGTALGLGYNGAVYVYEKTDSGWNKVTFLKTANRGGYTERYGWCNELSDDGRVLVIPGDGSTIY
jgi:hypothetical protein